MRVLVTGGHGFVGTHLVRQLLADGALVRCLYRRAGEPASLAGLDVEIVPGDIRDPERLAVAVAGVDEVYHLAALTRSMTRRQMLETNVGGTRHLLEACRRAGTPGRVVLCSSLAATGPSRPGAPVDEHAPHAPITWYGESKALCERLAAHYRSELPISVVRPPAVYGPRDKDFLRLFKSVAQGLAPVVGDRSWRYSMITGADLAAALVATARSPATEGGVWFATHPETVTQDDMLDAAEAALGCRARRLVLPASLMRLVGEGTELASQLTGRASILGRQRMREVATGPWVCLGQALEAATGWRATTDLATGFRETAAWYRDQGFLPTPDR